MNAFGENAFCWLLWRAILVAMVGAVVLLTHPLTLAAALLVAANVALLFSLVLMVGASRLSEDRIDRSAAWQSLRSIERPSGAGGRRWACNCLKERMLRFAKGASLVAALSSASALLVAGA